ncbi:MAG: hypothetical protein KKB30_17055, partial [Proteobacteria bacterium]|nr:hypothetical protein [Pseudomonadota bacterium]
MTGGAVSVYRIDCVMMDAGSREGRRIMTVKTTAGYSAAFGIAVRALGRVPQSSAVVSGCRVGMTGRTRGRAVQIKGNIGVLVCVVTGG